MLQATLTGFLVGNRAVIAGKIHDLIIVKLITFEFTKNRRTVPSQFLRNNVNGELRVSAGCSYRAYWQINNRGDSISIEELHGHMQMMKEEH
ncbi:hypothetical protein QBD00_003200 [Ochrobactrum sp. AN78]|nr:hypothetical protein [Ochrobactrum sp. AN78]